MLTYLYLILMASPTKAFSAKCYRASMTVVSSIVFSCRGFSHVSLIGLFLRKSILKLNSEWFLRVFDRRPGESRGERRAEEILGRVPFARDRPPPSQAGHHSSALQWVCLCTHVFHRVGTLQPLNESPGKDKKHELIRALTEWKCGASG